MYTPYSPLTLTLTLAQRLASGGESMMAGCSEKFFLSHVDRGRAQDDVGLMGDTDLRNSGGNGTVNEACVEKGPSKISAATGWDSRLVKAVR